LRRIEPGLLGRVYPRIGRGTIMAESREFRTMLEAKERELVAFCDQQIQALNSQVRLVSISPRWFVHLSLRR
jgi:hypothetical protein